MPQDGDAVGQLLDLVHLMGDDDYRLAGVAHIAQNGEKLVRLLRSQNGSGLVEDENIRAAVEHLYDLDRLLLGYAHLVYLHVGVHVEAILVADLPDLCRRRLQVEPSLALEAEDDILGRGEHVDELEVLVYHAYSQIERILGRADDNLFPVNGDLPLVGEVYAGEHIHKRGLAGAVFAQQSQYLASVYIQPYLIVGKHRAEGLGDIAHFYRRGFLLHFFSPNIFWSKLLQRAARRLKSLCCPLEQ